MTLGVQVATVERFWNLPCWAHRKFNLGRTDRYGPTRFGFHAKSCSTTSAQGGFAGGGIRDAVFAGYEGATEGNADGCRQAADSVCGGRVRGVGDRAHHYRDRQGEKLDRGSFRFFAGAGEPPGVEGQDRTGGDAARYQQHGAGELYAAEAAARVGTCGTGGAGSGRR